MYVLDTDVISGLRAKADADVVAWMDAQSGQLFLAATTIAEIEAGIAKLRRDGASRKASELGEWLEAMLHLYRDRILPFDLAAARIAGWMTDRALSQGKTPGFADTTIAATAVSRGMTVLTRNLKHFLPLGAPAIDPFNTLPHSIADVHQVRLDAIVAAANANIAVFDGTTGPINQILAANDLVWAVWQDKGVPHGVGIMIVKGVRRLEAIAGAGAAPDGVTALFERGATLLWSAISCDSAEMAQALLETLGDGAS